MRRFRGFLSTTLAFVVFEVCLVCCDITDGNAEHLKREHSLMKPYQGVGSSPSSQWDFWGSTLVTGSYVRLTPDERSKQGSIWNTVPCYLKDWEMHVQFKVHGSGKKNLHGDGIAIWYTKDRLHPGPVFGNQDQFLGLAIFLDTFRNDLHGMDRSFPYISAMVNNGSVSYDHGKDGRSSELGGCSAEIRNREHDTYLAIRYSKGRLTVMVDVDDKNEWKECIDIGGVRLPTGYFFGASAATGDLLPEAVGALLTVFLLHRQHRRSHRKLPRHPAHGLEGLPAPAVRSAGNRGVRRGGSRRFPEETGEEQEVLRGLGAAASFLQRGLTLRGRGDEVPLITGKHTLTCLRQQSHRVSVELRRRHGGSQIDKSLQLLPPLVLVLVLLSPAARSGVLHVPFRGTWQTFFISWRRVKTLLKEQKESVMPAAVNP